MAIITRHGQGQVYQIPSLIQNPVEVKHIKVDILKVLFHQGHPMVTSQFRHGPVTVPSRSLSSFMYSFSIRSTFTVTHRHAPVTVLNFPILGEAHAPFNARGEFCYMDVHFDNGPAQDY